MNATNQPEIPERSPTRADVLRAVAGALAKARTEYMAALSRCNASLRPNQIALLDDFIATKREHITEDVLAALRDGGDDGR